MNDTGYTIEDLDSDAKSVFLNNQLQLGLWDEVVKTVCAFSESDYEQTPILEHLVGLATLTSVVPKDFRAIVLAHVPIDLADFHLASDSVAMKAHRKAHAHFLKAAEAANQLVCPLAARLNDEYALWLELRDPLQSEHSMSRLQSKLRDPSTALCYVRYALQFGIQLDLVAVERDIDRTIAKNGGITIDAALARFALAFAQPTPEEVANYIARYHNQLAAYIDDKLMRYRQIEMLSLAGFIETANEVLDRLTDEGIPADEENNLRIIISKAQGNDPIESRKAQYEETKALSDLINLVIELEDNQRWDDLCDYGKLLFDETHYLGDALRLVNAYNKTRRSEEVVSFLKDHADLMNQSNHLRMSYTWGLYNEGALLESRTALAELDEDIGSPYYRQLQVNLGIATGDWASLTAYTANEYKNRSERSANDLIETAKLALHIGSPHAKDLVFEAAAKAEDDSAVLAEAYFVATKAGWEDESLVLQWLERAAELSGNDGPIKKMSLNEIVKRKPDWDRHEEDTWRLLAQGKVPIFLAAETLNRTLIDVTIFPALDNVTKTDPRRKVIIPAYSGKHEPSVFDIAGKTVALDASALLTLSFLKLQDVVLNAFESVYIAHSTLGWLFEERQKSTYHQPSRIANAHKIHDMLASGVLERFMPSTVASSDLTTQVGVELAALIAEAENRQCSDDVQHVVVRSAPVHRHSSLMQEEADLSAHADVLSSCLAVVEKLRQNGQLTADEEKKARAYLQLHEQPWPNQPEITDGAILYLDDLTISYFQQLDLLNKLKSAGLTAVISQRTLSDANDLIAYESITGDVMDAVERIRVSLNSRIESGCVRVSRRYNFYEEETKSISEHPSVGILPLVSQCDVFISDDRFINQHAEIDIGGAQAPVFTTLDLLDALVVAGVISDGDRLELRTKLRLAGYFFVPIGEEELVQCLNGSAVVNEMTVETAELKAIRESVLHARMSNWLQLPEELPWLDGTLKTYLHVLKKLWVDSEDMDMIIARSNWLVKQLDIRGWAHSLVPDNADNVVRLGRAAHILMLLTPPTDVQKSITDAYWNWVEEKVLVPIQEQFPKVYEWLVDWYRSYITKVAENLDFEEDTCEQ
ncbi:MAG: HNH endonuclease [Candidatus Thiodiazotropha sp. (ex Lucina pensylvanica)]|nr:HNH endonuclease [Candidatus Thiodiazotropha sp. (ex Lucina pensylvanica)]